jgi:hypothetical protein
MGMYAVNNRQAGTQQNITTTFKSQISVTAQTTGLRRGNLAEIIVGPDGAPNATDCQIVHDITRCSGTIGTGTSATPSPLNPADAASATVGTVNFTIETATTTTSLWQVGLNQRASQRWIAAPGQELIWAATNLVGLLTRALSPTNAVPVNHHVFINDL